MLGLTICSSPFLHRNSTGIFLKPFLYAAGMFAPSAEKCALNQIWAAVSHDAQSGNIMVRLAWLLLARKQQKTVICRKSWVNGLKMSLLISSGESLSL